MDGRPSSTPRDVVQFHLNGCPRDADAPITATARPATSPRNVTSASNADRSHTKTTCKRSLPYAVGYFDGGVWHRVVPNFVAQ
ncbi:MAG: hypothetical protein ABI972_24835, partial [Acidobacteriota bacterium]